MPITQHRMVALLEAAREFYNAGRRSEERLAAIVRRQQAGGDFAQTMLELELFKPYDDEIGGLGSAEYKSLLLIEEKWFSRFGGRNARRAEAQRQRLGSTPMRGGPKDLILPLPRLSKGQKAPYVPVRKEDFVPRERTLDVKLQIMNFAKANGVDRETAAGILGYEMDLSGSSNVEVEQPGPTMPRTPDPASPVPDHLAPDEDIGDFSGLGGED